MSAKEGGAATAGFNLALVSSYPLLVFFASKAGKKKLAAPIWAIISMSTLFNFAYHFFRPVRF